MWRYNISRYVVLLRIALRPFASFIRTLSDAELLLPSHFDRDRATWSCCEWYHRCKHVGGCQNTNEANERFEEEWCTAIALNTLSSRLALHSVLNTSIHDPQKMLVFQGSTYAFLIRQLFVDSLFTCMRTGLDPNGDFEARRQRPKQFHSNRQPCINKGRINGENTNAVLSEVRSILG